MSWEDQVAAQAALIAELEQRNAALARQLAEHAASTIRLERRVHELADLLDTEAAWSRDAVARLRHREQMLAGVYASTSWRITAPLRAATSGLKRMLRPNVPATPALEPPPTPTVFVECSYTYHSDLNTGIQRVVRNVVRHAGAVAASRGLRAVPVILEDGRLVEVDAGPVLADKRRLASARVEQPDPPAAGKRARLRRLLRGAWRAAQAAITTILPSDRVRRFVHAPPDRPGLAALCLLPWRMVRPPPPAPADTRSLDRYQSLAGSVLVMLDSTWTLPIWPAVRRFRDRGGKLAGVIYDVIPVTHPHTSVSHLTVMFRTWILEHFRTSDALIGISRATADAVAAYFAAESTHPRCPRLDHFHLGSELDLIDGADNPRPAFNAMFAPGRHVFLAVGSLEPRKKHAYLLDAFDRFWADGGTAALVIIGRQAWKTDDVLERIATHDRRDRDLFLVRDATDAELDHAYRHASALVIPSEIEGFGLPVVEAFQRGLPVLCSDIPVFREIADGRATFFDLADPAALSAALHAFCAAHDPLTRDQRAPTEWLDWHGSTAQLFDALERTLQIGTAARRTG